MQEKRYVRFASITGIERKDLPIAAETWLEDVRSSCWADRNLIKLATLFTRYMRDPDPGILNFGYIESYLCLDKRQVRDHLRNLVIYGAAEAFDCDSDAVNATLHLSYLQRLRVLETRRRFSELKSNSQQENLPWWGCGNTISAFKASDQSAELEHAD